MKKRINSTTILLIILLLTIIIGGIVTHKKVAIQVKTPMEEAMGSSMSSFEDYSSDDASSWDYSGDSLEDEESSEFISNRNLEAEKKKLLAQGKQIKATFSSDDKSTLIKLYPDGSMEMLFLKNEKKKKYRKSTINYCYSIDQQGYLTVISTSEEDSNGFSDGFSDKYIFGRIYKKYLCSKWAEGSLPKKYSNTAISNGDGLLGFYYKMKFKKNKTFVYGYYENDKLEEIFFKGKYKIQGNKVICTSNVYHNKLLFFTIDDKIYKVDYIKK